MKTARAGRLETAVYELCTQRGGVQCFIGAFKALNVAVSTGVLRDLTTLYSLNQ